MTHSPDNSENLMQHILNNTVLVEQYDGKIKFTCKHCGKSIEVDLLEVYQQESI